MSQKQQSAEYSTCCFLRAFEVAGRKLVKLANAMPAFLDELRRQEKKHNVRR